MAFCCLGGQLSVSGAREVRDASNLGDRYSGSFLRFSSRANVDARITDQLSAEANLRYSPPTDLPQGRILARYAADETCKNHVPFQGLAGAEPG